MRKAPKPSEQKKKRLGGVTVEEGILLSNETTPIGDYHRSSVVKRMSSSGITEDTSTSTNTSSTNTPNSSLPNQHLHYGSIMIDEETDPNTVNVDEPGQQQRRSSFGMEVDFEIPATPEEQLEEGTTYSNNGNDKSDTSSTSVVSNSNSSDLRTHLTSSEIWNLMFCILAWACTIANVTLVVGTSNVVLLSIDGSPNLSSVPLATFFVGASLVSCLITPWHFTKFGRQRGFLIGVASGLVGSILGCLAVVYKSTSLLIIATTLFGSAMGIGFYLRFAAVEVVPISWADKAVTLVVSGGCIAAFAGPESAEGTRGMFGPEYEFLGVFVMTGLFNFANGICTYLVQFPDAATPTTTTIVSDSSLDPTHVQKPPESPGKQITDDNNSNNHHSKKQHWRRVIAILKTRHFLMPMFISALSWIIMAFPMSILRVAMHQVGFTSRQSLLTIELHFLGMYAPGFVSGRWIARYGPRLIAIGSSVVFAVAAICLLLANNHTNSSPDDNDNDNESSNIALWIVGMVLIGIGWNCAFSGSTVGSTRSYFTQPDCKSAIQAANDGLTFLLAGAIICCASSIYQAGGEGLEGWRTANWIVVGFIVLFSLLLMVDIFLEKRQQGVDEAEGSTTNPNEMWSTASMPLSNHGKAGK